ncbi:HXXEE domain-containing protein [Ureibacillus thermosphaericus]|uniref:HXXEE domain-containing protein n=1 Tax=Ureibacillus thermosphaericus TaxID=51173 RepID=UPI0014445BFB|nr:HXXEE domain-containing protein [Ureibacillus thermosphaericus]NKZ31720.1 HXXEE domain-containing protein [Ureibacillus thermosphaericus]
MLSHCFAITFHNKEEAVWLPKWSQQTSKFHKPVTPSEFHFAVFVITMLAYLSAFYFFYNQASELAKWFFIGFLGSIIVNAIFPHLITTILMKKYAPRLITGLFLNIPFNLFIIVQMFLNHYITWKELIISTIAVGSLLLALIPLLFKVGGRIASSREQK